MLQFSPRTSQLLYSQLLPTKSPKPPGEPPYSLRRKEFWEKYMLGASHLCASPTLNLRLQELHQPLGSRPGAGVMAQAVFDDVSNAL